MLIMGKKIENAIYAANSNCFGKLKLQRIEENLVETENH